MDANTVASAETYLLNGGERYQNVPERSCRVLMQGR